MAAAKQGTLIQYLRAMFGAETMRDLSDGQLLELFATEHDEIAFGALLRRHGRLVLGVCRRVLGPGPDQDDAFQAVFLVLARKARSIRRQTSVASWLYGVALRLSRDLKAKLTRRQRHERSQAGMEHLAETTAMQSDPAEQASMRELAAILDDEVQRLPKKNREPLVLCHLEGLSAADAAKRLGCPEPTLKSRLARARELIRQRLVRRGITLSAASLAVVFSEQAARAVVPAKVAAATLQGAVAFAAKPVASAAVSAQAVALAKGVLKTMMLTKISVAVLAVVTTGMLGYAAAMMPGEGASGTAPREKPVPAVIAALLPEMKPEKQAAPVKGRVDLLGDLLPEGAVARLGTLRFKQIQQPVLGDTTAVFSPDGKRIAVLHGIALRGFCLWDATNGKELPGPWTGLRSCNALAFSPDGAMLADAGADIILVKGGKPLIKTNIILWDIAGAKALRIIECRPEEPPHTIGFADGGKSLLSQTQSSEVVRSWDVATGKQLRSWKPLGDIKRPADETGTSYDCFFSPGGKYMAAFILGSNSERKAISEETDVVVGDLGGIKGSWRIKSKVYSGRPRAAFSADSKKVALLLGPNSVELRETATGKVLGVPPLNDKIPHRSWNRFIALSSDGNTLALAGDSKVSLWSLDQPTLLRPINGRFPRPFNGKTDDEDSLNNRPQCLAFSPDGKTLLVSVDTDLQLYEVATLKEVFPWDGHRGSVDYLAFSSDGKGLLSGSGQVDFNPFEVLTWATATWKLVQLSSLQTPKWPNVGVPSPEHTVHTGKTGDDRFSLYDSANGKLLTRLAVPKTHDPAARGFFSPDSKFYVLAGKDGKGKNIERLYAVPSGKLLCELPGLGSRSPYESMRPIAFSPDGRIVAHFDSVTGVIRVFETANGKLVQSLAKELPGQVAGNLAFSRDGKWLAAWNSAEQVVRVWEWTTGKERLRLPLVEDFHRDVHFAWSPDGGMLAVSESNKIRLWESATIGVRRELSGHEGDIRSLAFSPDGRLLASGSWDTTVLIWDMGNPAPRKLTDTKVKACWSTLAEPDAAKAFEAILALTADPTHAVSFLKQQLKPAAPLDGERVKFLIPQLDDGQYKVRERAISELRQMGDQVLPLLNKALTANPPLEMRRRLEALRDHFTTLPMSGERLRLVRAVEILERIGDPPARQLLQTLANGPAGALETTAGQSALQRLNK